MLERSDLGFDRTVATVQVAVLNLCYLLLKVTRINELLQLLFLLLSIAFLIWKWRREFKRKDGPR